LVASLVKIGGGSRSVCVQLVLCDTLTDWHTDKLIL